MIGNLVPQHEKGLHKARLFGRSVECSVEDTAIILAGVIFHQLLSACLQNSTIN